MWFDDVVLPSIHLSCEAIPSDSSNDKHIRNLCENRIWLNKLVNLLSGYSEMKQMIKAPKEKLPFSKKQSLTGGIQKHILTLQVLGNR